MTEALILDEFSRSEVDAGRQRLVGRIENAKEEARVRDWAVQHKAKMMEETEQKSQELGHGEVVISRAKEPEKRFPNDEKTEQRLEDEKTESFDRNIKGMDGDYLKDLEKDLNQRRNLFASIELSEGAKLAEVRKKLGSKNIEESLTVVSAREQYQKTLERYKDAKIEELRGKGLSGEALKAEMTELIRQFGYIELVEMNNARNDAKAEEHMGQGIVKKCWGLLEKTANAYNRLPLWTKLGISAGVIASGAGLLIAGKRVLGSIVAGVGTAKGLDALHQRSVGKTANKDAEKIIAEMDKITFEGSAEKISEEKYKLMRAALDIKLENVDERLKRQKMVSLCNKFIGISVGVFLGSGMASRAIGGVFGKVSDHFDHTKHVTGAAKGMLADTKLHTPLTDAMEHPKGVPVEKIVITAPHPDAHGHIKHDSFSRSLMNYLKDQPNMDKAELKHIHEVTFRDGIARYAQDHKMSYGEAVKKLSGVHAGTSYQVVWDADGHPHMHIDDEHTKFVKSAIGGHHPAIKLPPVPSAELHDPSVTDGLKHAADSHVSNDIPPVKTEDMIPYDPEHDYQKIETEMKVENAITQANKDYAGATNEAMMHPAADGPSVDQYERMGTFDNTRKSLTQMLDNMKAEDLPWSGTTEVSALLEKGAGTKQILGTYLNKITEGRPDKFAFWNEIKNKPFGQVEFGDNTKGVTRTILEFQKAVGDKYADQIYPKKDLTGNMTEKTGAWLARITKLALQVKK